jgi:hypothetical protein
MTEALSNAVAGIIATLAACSWLGRNAIQDDADTHACHELVLDSLRDQLSLADAIALHEEAQLSKFGTRRN